MSGWAAVAQVGSEIGSSALNYFIQKEMLRRQNEANKEMAKYQYSKDLEMWQRQNQYNSPEAQMLRLQNAGLNPNLVYGTGSVTGNTSGQTPKYSRPEQRMQFDPNIMAPDILGKYTNFAVGQAQVENMNAQRELTEQKALTEAISRASRAFDLRKGRYQWDIDSTYYKTRAEHSLHKLDYDKRTSYYGYQKTLEQKKLLEKQIQIADQMLTQKNFENKVRAFSFGSSQASQLFTQFMRAYALYQKGK